LVVRNASPYWAIEYVKSSTIKSPLLSIPPPGYNWASSLPGAGTIPGNILRKMNRIRIEDGWVKKVRKGFLEFTNLTKVEAEHAMFKKKSGYIIYLGWWDWFCLGKMTKRIFNGIVKTAKVGYTQSGISISLELVNVGAGKCYEPFNPYDTIIQMQKVTSLGEAFNKIALYLEVGLAVNWWGLDYFPLPVDFLWVSNSVPKEKPWMMKPTKTANKKEVPITPADFLDSICDRYGKIWNIADNILYIGHIKISSEPEKMFNYRTEHDELFPPQLTHLEESTFDNIEILDPSTKDSGTLAASSVDANKKEIKSKNQIMTQASKDRPKLNIYERAAGTEALSDNVSKLIRQGANTVEAQAVLLEPDTKQLLVNNNSKTPEDSQQRVAGQSGLAQERAIAVRVSGVLGDPIFRAGDIFSLFGVMEKHEGSYIAVDVEHEYSAKGKYTMAITGVGSQYVKRSGGDLTLPSSIRKVIQQADKIPIKAKEQKKKYAATYDTSVSTSTRNKTAILGIPSGV
jgi:hypothetical protein